MFNALSVAPSLLSPGSTGSPQLLGTIFFLLTTDPKHPLASLRPLMMFPNARRSRPRIEAFTMFLNPCKRCIRSLSPLFSSP